MLDGRWFNRLDRTTTCGWGRRATTACYKRRSVTATACLSLNCLTLPPPINRQRYPYIHVCNARVYWCYCVCVGVCGNELCDARRHVSVCQLCAWTTHRTSCWLSFVHGVGGCQSCCCICIHFHCELYFPLLICRCSQADSYENTSRAFVNTAIGDAGTAEDLVADEALMLSDFTRVMKKCHQNFKYYNCFFFSIIVIWCVVIIGCSSSS